MFLSCSSNISLSCCTHSGQLSFFFFIRVLMRLFIDSEGWRMVKSETRRDAEILGRNPSPRLFGEKFRYSKKVKTNHEKTRLRDLSKTFPRFRDRAKIFRDPRFSRYHSPPLLWVVVIKETVVKPGLLSYTGDHHAFHVLCDVV